MRSLGVKIALTLVGLVFLVGLGCATGTGIESGAVELVGARMDKLEKLFENLSLQVTTTNNTQAENIYGGAGWVMLSGIGMIACMGGIGVIAFRSWLKHKRQTRSLGLLTTSIDNLPNNVKQEVTNRIKNVVASADTSFTFADQKNLRNFVDKHKQDPTNSVQNV